MKLVSGRTAGLCSLLAIVLVLPLVLGRVCVGEAVSPVRPLQTELIGPLDLSRVHEGSSVLLRVDLAWSGTGCVLRAGGIVRGHVVRVERRSKQVKSSEVELRFDAADCNGQPEVPFRLRLVALVEPAGGTFSPGGSGTSEAPPLADAVGLSSGGGVRSASAASAINDAGTVVARNLPSRITPGQVIGIGRTTLRMGEEGSTAIVAAGHDVRLERGTSLILTAMPVAEADPAKVVAPTDGVKRSAVAPAATVVAAAVAPEPEPVDETEVCSGVCNVVNGMAVAGPEQTSTLQAKLPLGSLGYAPRERRRAPAFDNDTTLTYLSATSLLCTFDPHELRQRRSGEEAGRTIRVVLIDPTTHSVKRVMRWRVEADDQYLWPLGGGRVLVHMGHELRLLDSELRPLRSVAAESRVAWVVSSPLGEHIAVGMVKERHSERVHRELEESMAREPEEDVEVRLLDGDLKPVLTAMRSSETAAPVLTDAGELRVRAGKRGQWRITEYRWDKTERTVASATSACRPILSAPERGVIFAVGCTRTGGRWYRALGPDGHALLKGESPSDEIEQTAEGTTDGTFAVRIVKTAKPWTYGQPFTREDLLKEEIAVYRGSDGRSVAAVTSDDFTLSQHSFALSPGGDQLSLAGADSILFYAVGGLRR